MELKPQFKKWLKQREAARTAQTGVPTQSIAPTAPAGPKNSNGPKGGSAKTKAKFNKQSRGKG